MFPRAGNTETLFYSNSTEILSNSPPLTALSSPPSSSSSVSHRFLRIGRRRGGPFKRSMIPALQGDISTPNRHSPSLKIMRRGPRKAVTSRTETPITAPASTNQVATSTDYDSDTSLEILTGEELVECMASKKRTRRSRHKRLMSPTKEPTIRTENLSRLNRHPWQGYMRRQIDGPAAAAGSKSDLCGVKASRPDDKLDEKSRSRRIKTVSAESTVNFTESERPPRPGMGLPRSPRREPPTEPSDVRVLRHREISISPDKKSKVPLRTVSVRHNDSCPAKNLQSQSPSMSAKPVRGVSAPKKKMGKSGLNAVFSDSETYTEGSCVKEVLCKA